MEKQITTAVAIVLGITLLASGCATKKYVRSEVDSGIIGAEERVSQRVDSVESQVETNQARLDEQAEEIERVSATARDALDRAIAAGKLAEGKLLYERVMSSDEVTFGFDEASLGEEDRAYLDEFAAELRNENGDVYIEVQGHTDATGPEPYNLRLGEERAEAVRRYLNHEHGIPLHRISIISYGESAPLADNATREGRARNRRVALVVLV